jgi:uncharacterized OsmC-like protein
MTTIMALHAAARGIEIKSIESKFEGDLDGMGFPGLNDQVRNGYQHIRVSFDIKGDLTEAQKQEFLSFTLISPVYNVVTNGSRVDVKLAE